MTWVATASQIEGEATSSSDSVLTVTMTSNLSAEQWQSLKFLVKFMNTQANTATSEKLSGKILPNHWIIGSGVTHHMTWKLELLYDIKDIPSWLITLPNAKLTFARKYGKSIWENI